METKVDSASPERFFSVRIGSPNWGCAYSFSHARRIEAFRLAKAAVSKIPDPALRPSEAELDSAYASLAAWDRHGGKSPRMTHESASRAWYLQIDRLPPPTFVLRSRANEYRAVCRYH
ncbi:MAG TPA: hypothetical protein VMF62_12360 [Acetobacteraceae bacterium]|nr:hypothetical protein [Acetobacteraceae bacterium]